MRFRIITNRPLPLIKSWILIPDNVQQRRETVQDLKKYLCTKFNELAFLKGDECKLSIDDFDLLDGESIDIIKENDLVCITKLETPIARKRRASELSDSLGERLLTKRRRKSVHWDLPENSLNSQSQAGENVPNKILFTDFTSESSSENSLSEDSSSDDLSTDDSSSDSSSTEDSSSEDLSISDSESDLGSSDAGLRPISKESVNTVKATGVAYKQKQKEKQTLFVPPGDGKPSTHSRNARRNLKRMYERRKKLAEQNGLKAVAENSANNVPLGERQSMNTTENLADEDQMEEAGSSGIADGIEVENGVGFVEMNDSSQPMSLRNKNKKNGFKRSMNGKIPQKIVFDDNGVAINGSGAIGDISPSKPRARLITPSERQDRGEIPDNIFVTSVELEFDKSTPNKWEGKQKKKKGRDNWGYGGNGEGNNAGDVPLDYVEEEEGKLELDLKKIEKGWNTYGEIGDATVLKGEDLVTWKSLAINPLTYTPEWMVGIGRIVSVNREEAKLTVKILQQAGVDQVSFGNGNGGIEDDNFEMQSETEEWSFEDVKSWRIVLSTSTG